MSVRKTEDRGWMVDFVFRHPDGRRERVRATSPVQTKRGAEQYERDLREQLLKGRSAKRVQTEVPTFSSFADEFVEKYAVPNNKPSEVRMKRSTLKHHLVPAFGAFRLDMIGAREIEAYKARKLKEGLSKKTVNNHLTIVRKLLVTACEWQLIQTVPRIGWLRAAKPDFDFLNFDAANDLIASCEPEFAVMVLVALRTGLRQGELLGLRWSDVDLVSGRLMVRRSVWRGHEGTPKSGRAREVPLSQQARDALAQHPRSKSDLVFARADGSQLNENPCRRPLYRACEAAGIRRIGWHVLRHTFASHLAMRGVPLIAIKELLGHSTIEMTMRYAHLSPEVIRNAVDRLDARPPTSAQPTVQSSEGLVATEHAAGQTDEPSARNDSPATAVASKSGGTVGKL